MAENRSNAAPNGRKSVEQMTRELKNTNLETRMKHLTECIYCTYCNCVCPLHCCSMALSRAVVLRCLSQSDETMKHVMHWELHRLQYPGWKSEIGKGIWVGMTMKICDLVTSIHGWIVELMYSTVVWFLVFFLSGEPVACKIHLFILFAKFMMFLWTSKLVISPPSFSYFISSTEYISLCS